MSLGLVIPYLFIVVLQAAFHPNETVQAVIDHVKESLKSAFSTNQFYLYVTPPMQKLNPDKTLAELNLVPAALSYLSWVDPPPPREFASAGFYLRDDLVLCLSIFLSQLCRNHFQRFID